MNQKATLTWALVAAGAVTRAALAWTDHGMVWPDEIFQTAEQAHRWAFGFGMVPWEFREGARSWLVPGVLGLLLKLFSALGADTGLSLMRALKLSCVAANVAGGVVLVRLVARRSGASAALLAAALWAAFPWELAFAHRTMGEMLAAPLLVGAAYWLEGEAQHSSWRPWGAGALAGLAFSARYQTALISLALGFPHLLARRDWRRAGAFLGGGAVVFALGGALDWVTWGKPFHALATYVRFNFLEGRSAQFGIEPWWLYLSAFALTLGPLAIALLGGWFLAVKSKAAPTWVAATLVFIAVHSFVSHKELRFILSVVPFMLAAAAVGLGPVLARWKDADVGAAAALVLAGGFMTATLTFERMGQFRGQPELTARSPFKFCDDSTQLASQVGAASDSCGLVWHGVMWAPGAAYLHKEIPQFWGLNQPNAQSGNYLIAASNASVPSFYEKRGERGDFTLYRREGACVPAAGFDWNMPGP